MDCGNCRHLTVVGLHGVGGDVQVTVLSLKMQMARIPQTFHSRPPHCHDGVTHCHDSVRHTVTLASDTVTIASDTVTIASDTMSR